MKEKILVIGGTGMLGEPVARKLKADGYTVRILSRNPDNAKKIFAEGFEIAEGDIEDEAALKKAMEGCFGVHINLNGGPLPEDYDRVFIDGIKSIVESAKESAVQRLTVITGTSVFPENSWFYITKAKLKAEEIISTSGISYFIFRPSWFFESLPLFVRDGRASEVGKQEIPWHWLAASDYARMVSQSFGLEENLNKVLIIHGPEEIKLKQALEAFCKQFHPDIKVSSAPIWMMKIIAALSGKAAMKDLVKMMAYFEKVPEGGDPSEANTLLGAPKMTLGEWMKLRSGSN